MALYLFLIALFNVLIDAFNIFVLPGNLEVFWQIILFTLLETAICFVIDLLLAVIIRYLPEKWFNPNKKIFTIFGFEKKLYIFLGVKNYKDRIPEVGKGFRKNKVADPNNPDYIFRYLLECCYGEVIHLISLPLGFLAIFVLPDQYKVSIGVPVCIVNAILSVLPVFVLRYNRKRLTNVYKRLLKNRP